MFGPPTTTPHHHHHASKRRAEDDEPEGDHPITKRLARMRIGREAQERPPGRRGAPHHDQEQPHLQPTTVSSPVPSPNGYVSDDWMPLDDTKDKVYIHDLESEIAQIEAEDRTGIFLPDIDRKISAIPQQLLQSRSNNANTQLVLYQVPSSISVPEEQDHVRKAIIATRARARARAREEQVRKAEIDKRKSENHIKSLVPGRIGEEQEDDDPDAMDLG